MFAPQFSDIKYVFQALIKKAIFFSTRHHKIFLSENIISDFTLDQ